MTESNATAREEDRPAAHVRKRNALLSARMNAKAISTSALARKSGIDQRTIERWLEGETKPQRENAQAVAHALECEPHELWPQLFSPPRASGAGIIPAVFYPSRAHVPRDAWADLFGGASEQIDICVYGGTFLFDTVPRFLDLARDAARRGALIRFMAGDPTSEAVHQRGIEEQIEHSLGDRCRMTIRRLKPIADEPNVSIRVHGTPLYTSTFRADSTMVVNPHVYGSPASDNPVFILNRDTAVPVPWETYTTAFERIWATAHPVYRIDGGS
ncbi:helix-turn-helix domain-containing protein [Sinomonas sp. P47F7]|uniref:helix-turn-helix domain-containing protein n=1 Tax=Sinomonas sp. P47F7 TaxID=3410987 RepID=UPI003BF5A429